MASPFDAAMRAADAMLDRTFAERARIEPQSSGEYAATDDPERPSYEADVVVGQYPSHLTFKYVGKFDGDKPTIAADEIHVWAHEDQLPADRAMWPKAQDRVVLLTRPNDHALIIHAVEPDGVGRFMYRCVRTARS